MSELKIKIRWENIDNAANDFIGNLERNPMGFSLIDGAEFCGPNTDLIDGYAIKATWNKEIWCSWSKDSTIDSKFEEIKCPKEFIYRVSQWLLTN